MKHRDFLLNWDDDRTLADDIGVKYHQARDWYRRNSIPPNMWFKFVTLCREKGFAGITLESLTAAETGGPVEARPTPESASA